MKIIYTIVALPVVVVAIIAGLAGIDKQETVECLKWKNEASAYPSYFIVKWQKDQCDAHNIAINAVVLEK